MPLGIGRRGHAALRPAIVGGLIEFITEGLNPWLAFWAVPIKDLAHLAEVFFSMEAVQNLRGLGK